MNTPNKWYPPTGIASDWAVPGVTNYETYNFIALAFWGSSTVYDSAQLWVQAQSNLKCPEFGNTNEEIWSNLVDRYHSKGMRILVSAFGSTEFPTSGGKDPVATAEKLAQFVLDYQFDGADIDWEDNSAMEAGKGEQWLIDFTKTLRAKLPNHIITHAPQAPYFKEEYYQNGAYVTIHKEVGHLIDFYNVQFYNQGDTQYNSYEELFIHSTGTFSNTAVKEIIDRGIPAHKIVIGKPATERDVMNTGYVTPENMNSWLNRGFDDYGWYGGAMIWQLRNDPDDTIMKTYTSGLLQKCIDAGITDSSFQPLEP